eukprot:2545436-Amphidinium_carterae.1
MRDKNQKTSRGPEKWPFKLMFRLQEAVLPARQVSGETAGDTEEASNADCFPWPAPHTHPLVSGQSLSENFLTCPSIRESIPNSVAQSQYTYNNYVSPPLNNGVVYQASACRFGTVRRCETSSCLSFKRAFAAYEWNSKTL